MAGHGEPQHWGGFDDLGDLPMPGPSRTPAEIAEQVKRDLGYDVPQRFSPPDGPDVSGLAEGLGLK